MSGFTKLFSSITSSSIWNEDDKTRIVWITMLAICEPDAVVRASIGGLAHTARVSREDCEKAIERLLAPDPDSRSKEFEGRRIEAVDGGYLLLNYGKYREARSEDERREYMKEYMREYRKHGVSKRKRTLAAVSHGKPQLAQGEEEGEKKDMPTTLPGYAVPACFEKVEGFTIALGRWIEHRRKLKKPPTDHAIQLFINRLSQKPERALAAIDTTIEKGWQSFEWQWLDNQNNGNHRQQPTESPRNIGTANEGKASQYAGVGKVRPDSGQTPV